MSKKRVRPWRPDPVMPDAFGCVGMQRLKRQEVFLAALEQVNRTDTCFASAALFQCDPAQNASHQGTTTCFIPISA